MENLVRLLYQKLSEMNPICLRRKFFRSRLIYQLKHYIAEAQLNVQEACNNLVIACIQHHIITQLKDSKPCMLKKDHNILYVAAKLAFDYKLANSTTVAYLLQNIYSCEHSFERFLLGAIFGVNNILLFLEWESDFKDREENIQAVLFFMDHSARAKVQYCPVIQRFIDVPIECCGYGTPIQVCVIFDHPEMLQIFLQYGAVVPPNFLRFMCRNSPSLFPTLKLIMRAVNNIYVFPKSGDEPSKDPLKEAEYLQSKFGDLIQNGTITRSSCGYDPSGLQHLCRLKVRSILRKNHQLPYGIETLKLPTLIKEYLNLNLD